MRERVRLRGPDGGGEAACVQRAQWEGLCHSQCVVMSVSIFIGMYIVQVVVKAALSCVAVISLVQRE